MKNCRKVWNFLGRSLIAPALFLSILLPSRSFGDTYGDFAYSVSGTNVTITNYFGSSGSVAIPSSIPDVGTVIAIGDYSFSSCTSLTSVVIPNSAANIGSYVFSKCRSLTNVTIGNSITNIGGWAFNYCSNLTSVVIPDSVGSIGNGAFYECRRLTSVTIPNSVTSIGNYAFGYCTSLTNVTIPNSVTSIEDDGVNLSLAESVFLRGKRKGTNG